MLTFEKVLKVFQDYLMEDTRYEVVMTSRGYTVLEWDSTGKVWIGAELCASPESMCHLLLDDFSGYLEYKAIMEHGEITAADQQRISNQRQTMLKKLR